MPEIDSTTLASLNAMDADGLRSFAKEHDIRVTTLPNVRVETLRSQIVTELETRLTASTDSAPTATETTETETQSAETETETAQQTEDGPEQTAEQVTNTEEQESGAAEPEAAAEAAPEAVVAADAEFVPYEGETVRMFHPNPAEGMPEFADVHPDEVENWGGEGWLVADESDADNG